MGKSAIVKGKAPIKDKNNKRKREGEYKSTETKLSLFGGVIDKELDDVFAKSTAFSQPIAPIPVASTSKVHLDAALEPVGKKGKKEQEHGKDTNGSEDSGDEDETLQVDQEITSETDEDASNEEQVEDVNMKSDIEEKEDDESSIAPENLVHESFKAQEAKKAKKSRLSKYSPSNETPEDKNRRTVFIGNLPNEAAKSKRALKQLKAHIKSFVPTAKIESIRFRSVAFATPTAPVPTDDPEKDASQRAKREKERTAAWKAKQNADDEDASLDKSKVFIDAKGKRKVAFIKKEFHSEIDSCNAYVVFEHPHPDRASNVAPVQDPFEAATQFISAASGSTCLGRTIRTDSVKTLTTSTKSKKDWLPSSTDPKKSLFVGGLDYAAKEEDVKVFFEELVKAERGDKNDGKYWVTGVRIVRDKETQLGKGFGYVHFTDQESVEEILALDSKKIKFAKRYLRVQPCKTLPSSNTLNNAIKKVAAGSLSSSKDKIKKKKVTRVGVIPKGDPALGEKLKELSKEERKAAKSSDTDRLARRLAKKQAKLAMDKNKERSRVKLSLTKAEKEKTNAAKKPKAKKGKKRAPGAIAKMKGSRV
ncbi:hypothetical protein L204_106352 [Cryptococcus depauperatus]|nr:nucleolar protein 12 [Cryptococcus depauperatus CBS 7855]